MRKECRRANRMFFMALGLTLLGVFLISTPAWFGSVVALYLATFCLWQGFLSRGRMARLWAEDEWWRLTKLGVKLSPLRPCCIEYDKSGFLHEDTRCTRDRRKDRKPPPRTPGDWAEINNTWNEMIEHFRECGEET